MSAFTICLSFIGAGLLLQMFYRSRLKCILVTIKRRRRQSWQWLFGLISIATILDTWSTPSQGKRLLRQAPISHWIAAIERGTEYFRYFQASIERSTYIDSQTAENFKWTSTCIWTRTPGTNPRSALTPAQYSKTPFKVSGTKGNSLSNADFITSPIPCTSWGRIQVTTEQKPTFGKIYTPS